MPTTDGAARLPSHTAVDVDAHILLSCRGDADLRSSYSTKLKHLTQRAGLSSDIRHAVDLGCSTGLSTLELHDTFPDAQLTAVDLSPHFIAVATVTQRRRQVQTHQTLVAESKTVKSRHKDTCYNNTLMS